MGERATPLLIATFVGGVGWGAWLAPSLSDSPDAPRAVAKVAEAPVSVSSFRDAAEHQPEQTFDAEPAQVRAIEEQVDEVDDFGHDEELVGISAADAILALEQRYQELLKQLNPIANEEEEEEEEEEQETEVSINDPQPDLAEDILAEPEAAPAIAVAEPPSAAPTFEQGEGQQYSAEVINIHNEHDLSETNNQQVVVVQSQLPYYGGYAVGTVSSQANESSTVEQVEHSRPASPYAPWAERRPSQTNPWAPIDYSTHHNPYSVMISGKSSTLPRVGGSGLSVIYRR